MKSEDEQSVASTDESSPPSDDESPYLSRHAELILRDLELKRSEIDSAISALIAMYPDVKRRQKLS